MKEQSAFAGGRGQAAKEFGRFFAGKRVLVTGDTGFKGTWLCAWLLRLGAQVYGLGLAPNTEPSAYELLGLVRRIGHRTVDIRDLGALEDCLRSVRPDVVFHLAAQALVRLAYVYPVETVATNVLGTANILKALSGIGYSPERRCVVVVITSDKCYENRETLEPYSEEDPLGGHDLYSASKACAEIVCSAWRRSFLMPGGRTGPWAIALATCRAGNVIGGGDWSPDRIVPDAVRALVQGIPLVVRNPGAIRPWQHVLEPLSGYLSLAQEIGSGQDMCAALCSSWNFGPGQESEQTVGHLCDGIIKYWGGGAWEHQPDIAGLHEATYLKLAVGKASHMLGWRPVWDFETCIQETVQWYKLAHESRMDPLALWTLTCQQIEEYVHDAFGKGLRWVRVRQSGH